MGLLSFFRRTQVQQPESLRQGPPDPVFMGDALVYAFVDNHFGLTDPALDELVFPLPEAIRDPARYWTILYLCWLFRMKLRAKYGEVFFAQAFKAASARLEKSDETKGFVKELSFWFEQFDNGAQSLGQKVQGVEIPMEYFAALALLGLSPDSPFFRRSDLAGGDIEFDLAAVLEKGKKATQALIEAAGEIGGPLNG